MATVLRNTDPMAPVIATAVNDIKAQIGHGSSFHLDASEVTVTAANATDGPTAITLANNILAVFKFHASDLLAHKANDATVDADLAALSPCTDNTTCIALVLAMCTAFTAHLDSTTANYADDSTNDLSSSTVTTIGQAETVATDMKAKLNAHMASAPAAKSIRLIDA